MKGMSTGYCRLIRKVMHNGLIVAPRGLATRELTGFQFHIDDPTDNLPVQAGRNLNAKIAYAEALQLISGRSFPELMVKVAPNFAQFTDGGTWFHGAYGPRARVQLENLVMYTFDNDFDTRQAIVTIWDAAYDGHGDVADTPCTIALQFLARNNQLECVTTMRSNDVWWGTPYDVFQFTMLQIQLAHTLSLRAGKYTHQAGSFHMYKRDEEAALGVHSGERHRDLGETLQISTNPSWYSIRDVAESVLRNESHEHETEFARYMRFRLHD